MLRRPCDDNPRMCPTAPHYVEVPTDEDDSPNTDEEPQDSSSLIVAFIWLTKSLKINENETTTTKTKFEHM